MKLTLSILFFLFLFEVTHAQQPSRDSLVAEFSSNACKCIDSISTTNKNSQQISTDINGCLKKQVIAFQFTDKINSLNLSEPKKKGKKKRKETITLDMGDNSSSPEYQRYYFELERYTKNSCQSLNKIIKVDDAEGTNTFSKNPDAVRLYEAAVDDGSAGKFEEAISKYKAALEIDSLFSFAWDNLGVAYRKLERYPEAITAYQKSLAVNPKGKVPLQNIAIVYEYQNEYQKSIDAYQKLQQLDDKNPEVYYGIGRIYTYKIHDYEKGLDNICSAYSLYVSQRSPYRTDAENVISFLYAEMKKEGKEKRFHSILKEHNITSE